MEYAKHDSSGTEDDPSLQHINYKKEARFSRAAMVPLARVPYGMGLTEMEFQIHCIEREAYSAVLRAFIAQADVLSWDKEGLISELRKELRVSDVEHREILGKADSDESIKMIRKQRSTTAFRPEPLSTTIGPNKKLKTVHTLMSSSPNCLPCLQPSPASFPSLTLHCRENQHRDGSLVFSSQGNVGCGLKSTAHDRQASSLGEGMVSLAVQPTINYPCSDIHGFKKHSSTIRIRLTDKLINEVERVFAAGNPDRAQIENAKLILREHERALIEALEKIGDVSDGDDSPNCLQPHYLADKAGRNVRDGNHLRYVQADRKGIHFTNTLLGDQDDRSAMPHNYLKDEDGYNVS